jgi:hypothetical protein
MTLMIARLTPGTAAAQSPRMREIKVCSHKTGKDGTQSS